MIDVAVWQILQVVILARECGLRLELDNIKVQNLVPQPLQVRHLLASERSLLPHHLVSYDYVISLILKAMH